MKPFTPSALLATTVALTAIAMGAAPSHAGTLHNGWNYAIDSFNDGYTLGVIGARSEFEFYSMALRATNDRVYVALNSNLAREGARSSHAADGWIGYGDLFFNFTGLNLPGANGNLFAVHFGQNTNSGAASQGLGLYGNVTGQNVAKQNSGFNHLNHHTTEVAKKGGTANLADLSNTDPYFGNGVNTNHRVLNSIASGTRLGGIDLLDSAALAGLGIDFGHFGAVGHHTFGFSFDRSLLPDGDFIAHVFAECINDGLAMVGTLPRVVIPDPDPVPEPMGVLGLVALGGLAIARKGMKCFA